jgi:N-formylglutamate amidohydrolase
LKQLILHIPHSSPHIPFKDGYTVPDDILQNEINKLTDWHTDDLFHSESDITIKADFSRIFCDVERFPDDKDEIMSAFGMGVLYTKTDSGEPLRNITPDLRNKILNEYYYPHHKKLSEAVKTQLEMFSKAIIIDCHSFPQYPFERDLNKEVPRPDFSIGIDSFHTPDKLKDTALEFFKSKGYSIYLNKPYKGTIVPLEYYRKNKSVHSIMLEINRKLYMNETVTEKSENYTHTKKLIKKFIKEIKTYL